MRHSAQTKLRRYKWLLFALTPCLVLSGGGGWLVASESGLRWLAGVVERQSGGKFSAIGVSGSLINSFGMQQLVLRGDKWSVTLQHAQVQWHPAALLRGELELQHLSARQVEVLSLPTDTRIVLPGSLGLPLDTSVTLMKIDSLHVISSEGTEPDFSASDVEARFAVVDRVLKLQAMSAKLKYGDFAGSGEIALNKSYVVKAQATLDTAISLSGKSEHAHFLAEVGGDLQSIDVKFSGDGAGVNVNGVAQLAPLANVPVSRLQIAFSGMKLARLFEAGPSAVISGSVDLRGMPSGKLEGSLQVRNAHAAPLDRNGLPLLGVTAKIRLSSSHWQLQQLDARLSNDGHIMGVASWEEPGGKLSAQLKVHQLDPAAFDTRMPATRFKGDIMLAGVGDTQRAVVVLDDGTLNLFGELERQDNQVVLTSMRLSRGKSVLNGHGQLMLDRRRTFRFFSQLRSLNLSEFAAISPTDLNAGLEVSGTLIPEAKGTLQLTLSDSHFAHHSISGNGHLEFVGVKQATGTVNVRLGDNHFNLNLAHDAVADHVQLLLDAPNLNQLNNEMDGQLAGRADLSGSRAEPRLQFSAQLNNLTLPDGQRIATLDATGDLAPAAMQLHLGVKGYHGSGELNMPEGNVELHGSREQHTLTASAQIAQGDNTLGELTLKANGGLSDLQQGWQKMQWHGTLDELAAGGVVPFRLMTAAPLSFASNSFHIGKADVSVSGGYIKFSDTQWMPQRWHSAGLFSGLNVRVVNMQQNKFISDAFDTMRFGGTWEATADQHWQGQLQAQLETGDWVINGNTDLRLGLRDMRLSLRAEQDQLLAKLDASGEHLGTVAVQASVPLRQSDTGWSILPDAPLAGHLRLLSKDLSWLGPALDGNLQSGGRLDLDADLIGNLITPRLQGYAHGDELSFSLLDQGIRLEQGQLKARFDSNAVHIDDLSFSVPYPASPRDKLLGEFSIPAGDGKLNASGRIDLEGGSGNLQITAERLPLVQRADRWIIASGAGHAHYEKNTLMLDGNIRADAGLINQPVSNRPRWSDDVQIIGREPTSRTGPPSAVSATLDLGEHFYIRASGLEARLAGQLDVHSEPGEALRVTGIIAAHDALFDAYGQRLQVERGWVNFQGPLDDPGLNILALRKGLSVEAGVEVTGTVRRPAVRLVSTPNVPDGEKLSWIILGRVPESSGVDNSLLLAAASNILGSQAVGQFGQALGVDEISLSQQAGTDSQQIDKVTVGKRLSSRALISYEQGLNEVGGVTKFTYTLTPRITIVTRTGTEDALDLFYTFRFY